jgi:hypothetical protein
MNPENPIDPGFRAQVESALRAELPDEALDPELIDNLCRILATKGPEPDPAHAVTLYQLHRMAAPGRPDPPPPTDAEILPEPPSSAEILLLASLSGPSLPGYGQLTLEHATGGYNTYRAVESDTGGPVLIQVFQPGFQFGLDRVLRFLDSRADEAHPNLLRLKRHGNLPDGSLYLVFEGCEATRLSVLLSGHGSLSVARACGYTRQVALALQAIHADGHVHLDIKPSNLLVSSDRQRVWIADYTLVRRPATDLEGTIAGTLLYMAPEQARGVEYTDARTDLYGLGCTLYEMLAGRPLFAGQGSTTVDLLVAASNRTGAPALSFVQEVPEPVLRVLRRLLAAEADDRYPDALGLIADLDALLHVPCQVSITFPDEVAAGVVQRLHLVLSRVRSPGGLPEILPEGPGLTVSVAAENFRIDGPAHVTIPLPPPGRPARLSFALAGLTPGPGRVMLDFRQGTRPAGSLDLSPRILPGPPPRGRGPGPVLLGLLGGFCAGGLALAAAAGLDDEWHKEDSSAWVLALVAALTGGALAAGLTVVLKRPKAVTLTLPLDAAAPPGPDVLLKVHHYRLGGGPGQLHFSLCSSRPDLADLPVLDGDVGTCELRDDLAGWIGELLGSLAELAGSAVPPVWVQRALVNVGTQVFETVIPAPLRGMGEQLRKRGVRSLLVLSDEAHVPWELVRPFRAGEGGSMSEEPSWGETFALARWLRGRPPARCLPLRRALVVGAGQGGAPVRDMVRKKQEAPALVESVAEECALVQGLSARGATVQTVPARKEDFLQALEGGGFDLLHAASHGTRGTIPDADALLLEDGPLRVLDLPPRLGPVLWRTRPLVFFNACHSGRLGDGPVRAGSWGARLVELGCGGFIGTLCPVTDRAALTFARAFYARAGRGQAIGEVVRAARLEVRQAHPDDPSWLAYRCFADPTALLGTLPEPFGMANQPGRVV